jgi:hypothetical protein
MKKYNIFWLLVSVISLIALGMCLYRGEGLSPFERSWGFLCILFIIAMVFAWRKKGRSV